MDSVDWQPTIAQSINLCDAALTCGYKYVRKVKSKTELSDVLSEEKSSPSFIEVFVKKGAKLVSQK
ncbi:MAG: hypothetical protein LE180_04145 [Endomicrobium sp.]|uniref:hypothetical protein n=1 Tax=Candidatus Endomicrobiellum pyrsonymphae TaxID=1408203 RepID=UPI003573414D|nr:hypothetical protein [Endomicrobium sp.]